MEQDSLMNSLYETREWHDLIIRCGPLEEKVHRNIVCARSRFFKKACSRDWKEASSRFIDFPDDDPGLIARMIKWMYTLDYERPYETGIATAIGERRMYESGPQLNLDARLYSVGEKYAICNLKEAALTSFRQTLSANVGFLLGDEDQEAFADLLEVVYTSTPVDDLGLRQCFEDWLLEAGSLNMFASPGLLPTYAKSPDLASAAVDVMVDKVENNSVYPINEVNAVMKIVWKCHFGIETCSACGGHAPAKKHDASSPGGSSADCQIISATDFSRLQAPNQVTKKRKLLSDAKDSGPLMARYVARVHSTERFLDSENRNSSPLRRAL